VVDGDLAAIRAAAAALPGNAQMQHRLGLALLAANDPAGALPVLQEALNLYPTDPAIKLDLSVAQVRAGKPQAAERLLRELSRAATPPPLLYQAYFNLGVVLSSQGRVEDAIDAYEHAVNANPTAEALFNLAEAYLYHYDRARAIDAYRRALVIRPDYLPCANNLGKALLDSGDAEGAVKVLRDEVDKGGGGDAELVYNLAVAEARKGDSDAAVDAYRKAISLRPDYAEAHNNLGVLLGSRDGKQGLVGMLREFQAALRGRPRYALASYNLGVVLLSRGETEPAIASFRDALQDDPKMSDAYRGLGDAYFVKGKIAAAKEAYNEALRLNPGDAETQRQISLALVRSGSPEEALHRLRELVDKSPDDGRTRFFLARTLAETGQAEEAEKEYREALRLRDKDAEISFSLGELLTAQGRTGEALAQYELTLKMDDAYAPAWFRIAQASLAAGKYDRAITGFQRAAKLEPRLSAEADLNLGEVYYRRHDQRKGDLQKEIDAYREALRVRPDYGEARAELAFALYRDKKFDEALTEAQRAVRDAPDHGKGRYYLGVMLYRHGDTDQALVALREALRLSPDMAEADLALGEILWQGKKDHVGARAAYEAALRARPDYLDAKEALRGLPAAPPGQTPEGGAN
jgi:superkiller protein 3